MSLYGSRLSYDILYLLTRITVDHKTLTSIARTCRELSDVALGELWRDMDSLVPLLLLIPIKFYDLAALEATACQTLRLPKDQWHEFRKSENDSHQNDLSRVVSRILTYGKRIKTLRGVHTSRYDVHYETLEFLLDELPVILGVDHVIPSLKKLRFFSNEVSIHELSLQIRKLFVPDLESIILTSSCRGLLDYLDEVIIALLQNCPKLVNIKVICTGRLWSGRRQVMLDLESCLTPRVQEAFRTTTTNSTSLKEIHFTPNEFTGYRDIIATPSTLNVFALFRSITCLVIGIQTSHRCDDYGLIDRTGSAFPGLRFLRLRLHGSTPIAWFFDFIHVSRLQLLYFQFMDNVRSSELNKFVSSLERYRPKLANIKNLSFRATIYDQLDISRGSNELVQSVVTTSAQIFPNIVAFKLKLFPNYHTNWGLVQADDLPHIVGAFPGLTGIKVAAFQQYMSLTNVVALALRFPRLRIIGINFACPQLDALREDGTLVESSPESLDQHMPAPRSRLRTLAVRYSEIDNPDAVAEYLAKKLPCLWSVIKARNSKCGDWDTVRRLIRTKYY